MSSSKSASVPGGELTFTKTTTRTTTNTTINTKTKTTTGKTTTTVGVILQQRRKC